MTDDKFEQWFKRYARRNGYSDADGHWDIPMRLCRAAWKAGQRELLARIKATGFGPDTNIEKRLAAADRNQIARLTGTWVQSPPGITKEVLDAVDKVLKKLEPRPIVIKPKRGQSNHEAIVQHVAARYGAVPAAKRGRRVTAYKPTMPKVKHNLGSQVEGMLCGNGT